MKQTKHAVILAAGMGSRLAAEEGHKILARVGGRAMIDYHLDNFARLGVEHLTVVTGYRREELEATLAAWPLPKNMKLEFAYNPEFRASNGVSILAGVDQCIGDAPFWLSMSDHLFEPGLFEDLAEFVQNSGAELSEVQGLLGVDAKLAEVFDMPDANKIDLRGDIFAIGKDLETYNMIDVGFFWCGAGFVQALREERAQRGDCNTSDAVRRLVAAQQFYFWDVQERLWQDVDTPGARAHAEKLIKGWGAEKLQEVPV